MKSKTMTHVSGPERGAAANVPEHERRGDADPRVKPMPPR
jgi:hypothetical protein